MLSLIIMLLAFSQPPSPPPWQKLVPAPQARLGLRVMEGCAVEVVAEGPALIGATRLLMVPEGLIATDHSLMRTKRPWSWKDGRLVPGELGRSPLNGMPGLHPHFLRSKAAPPIAPGNALSTTAPIDGTMLKGDRFPPIIQGWWLTAHPGRPALSAYRVVSREGADAVSDGIDLVVADFRDMEIISLTEGPDGAVYALDIRGASALAPRILRLTWAGVEDAPALKPHPFDRFSELAKARPEALVEMLKGEDALARTAAAQALAAKPVEAAELIGRLMADPEAPSDARLEALRILEPHWKPAMKAIVIDLLEQPGEHLRMAAAEVLGWRAGKKDQDCAGVLLKALGDGDVGVRIKVAATLSTLRIDGGAEALANTLTLEDVSAGAMRAAFVASLATYGGRGMEALLGAAESGVRRQAERAVAVAAECGNEALVESLPRWLENPNLNESQRQALLVGGSRSPKFPEKASEKVLNWLVEHQEEAGAARAAGVEMLAKAGVVRGEQGRAFLKALLADANPAAQASGAMAAGIAGMKDLYPEVVALARKTGAPAAVRSASVRSLLLVRHASAVDAARAFLEETDPSTDIPAEWLSPVWEGLFSQDAATAVAVAVKRLPAYTDSSLIRVILRGARQDRAAAERLMRAAPLARLSDGDLEQLLDDPENIAHRAPLMQQWLGRQAPASKPADSEAMERGRTVFLSESARCIQCHRWGAGKPLAGPDAAVILRGRPRTEAIKALMYPSAHFDRAYESTVFKLKNGQEFTGISGPRQGGMESITGEDGVVRVVPTADMASRRLSGRSLMPDLAATVFNRNEANALVSLVEQGMPALAMPVVVRHVPVSPDAESAMLKGDLANPSWLPWKGELPSSIEGVLLEATVESATGGPARPILEGGFLVRIWVDGTLQPEALPVLPKGAGKVVAWVIPAKRKWDWAFLPVGGN
ncbi:MAG: hypothetical protein FJ261_04180 [Planctomycetes bacterium]|nr:hypothetical protein [Planctomycetota bacterium]